MDTDQPSCVLRTQRLCDGQEVADYRRAPGQRCHCYCWLIAEADDRGLPAIASGLRSDRARTVARSEEIQRLTDRQRGLLERGDSRW